MDTADLTLAAGNANSNQGLRTRYQFSRERRTIEIAGPIFCNVFRSERLLLSYVDMKVILNRNVNEFCLMASEGNADYTVRLTEAYFKIRKEKVSPSISIAHELALKKGLPISPIRRVENVHKSAGNLSLRKDNVFNGLVPKTFAMVMVDSAAFNGDCKKNPFNFKTSTTSFLEITVNGEEVPFRSLQLSYTAANPRYIEAFLIMFSGTGKLFYNAGNDVTGDECAGGYAVYVVDLTPDLCGPFPHINVFQRENLEVDIKVSYRFLEKLYLRLLWLDEHCTNHSCTRGRSYNEQKVLWHIS